MARNEQKAAILTLKPHKTTHTIKGLRVQRFKSSRKKKLTQTLQSV